MKIDDHRLSRRIMFGTSKLVFIKNDIVILAGSDQVEVIHKAYFGKRPPCRIIKLFVGIACNAGTAFLFPSRWKP